ncbi:uncharacterized protein DEA37_0011291 [Paragonimus westermani]|uniref:Fibronectin type-III domain-containing protein n=1 Tax=Paragonimus westermani TaxID=34504 RepID=A0A5J4P098_9TREM|nr:uncharacterized protein DEA37_0011291 [Paragonimus westermani]
METGRTVKPVKGGNDLEKNRDAVIDIISGKRTVDCHISDTYSTGVNFASMDPETQSNMLRSARTDDRPLSSTVQRNGDHQQVNAVEKQEANTLNSTTVPNKRELNSNINSNSEKCQFVSQSIVPSLPYTSPPVVPNYSQVINMVSPLSEPVNPSTGYLPTALVPTMHGAAYGASSLLLHPRGGPLIPTSLPLSVLPSINQPSLPLHSAQPSASQSSSSIPCGTELLMPARDAVATTPSPLLMNSVTNSHIPATVITTSTVSEPHGNLLATNGAGAQNGDYYVMVHVDAGATFSVRVGDKIQHIPGPATVRMVSSSGPPIPMPMQVPVGHLVQQIVDEEGILKHVILSVYPGPSPPSHSQPISAAPVSPALSNTMNGIVATATGLIMDSSQHLHHPTAPVLPLPHHHHHHHTHAHLAHSPSSLASIGNHLLVSGTPGSLATPFSHSHPNGPPTGHYHSQFMVHPHLGAPTPAAPAPVGALAQSFLPALASHPQHPPHSQYIPRLPQQGLKAVPNSSLLLNGCLTDASISTAFEATGSPDAISVDMVSERTNGDELDRKSLNTDHPAVDMDVSSLKRATSPSYNCELLGEIGTPSGVLSASSGMRDSDKTTPIRMPSSSTCAVIPPSSVFQSTQVESLLPNSSGPYRSCNKGSPVGSESVPTKLTTDIGEVVLSGSDWVNATSSEPEHRSAPHLINSPHHSNDLSSNLSQSPGILTSGSGRRRAGRAGSGKAHGSFRTPTRPSGFGTVNKVHPTPTNYPSLSGSSVNSNLTSSSAIGDNVHSTCSPVNVDSCPLGRVSNGWSAESNGRANDVHRTYAQSRALPNLSLTASHSQFRGRRLPPHNINYLLNNPSEHAPQYVCSEQLEPATSVEAFAGSSHDLVAGSDKKDVSSTVLHWETEWERETILSVSEVKDSSALIHLSLPPDLCISVDQKPNHVDPANPSHTSNTELIESVDGHNESTPTSSSTLLFHSAGSSSWALDENAIRFELHLAERDNAARFNRVFFGEATDISLQDLRPGSDYYVKYCCVYADLCGQFSPAVHFVTLSTEPSPPRNLTVVGHTRTSLHLKWSAAADNGSRVTAYIVEYAPAVPGYPPHAWHAGGDLELSNGEVVQAPHFVEGFHGLAKTCKLTQLNPSTDYLARVLAVNAYGRSPWSSIVTGSTSGSPPPTPQTPYLVHADVHTLTLAWHQPEFEQHSAPVSVHGGVGVAELTYTLEMDDEAMGHGFVTVFDGTGTEHCVENLRRNTRYRFRLAASNIDGRSRWTELVTFSTLPDRPSAPCNLRLANSIQPTRLSVSWDAPEDDGGLPVQAYRLELRLPYKIDSARDDDKPHQYSSENRSPQTGSAAGVLSNRALLCWPHVTGLPGTTTYASVPPSVDPDVTGPRFGSVPPKLVVHSSVWSASHDTATVFSQCDLCNLQSMQPDSGSSIDSVLMEPYCVHEQRLDLPIGSYSFAWFIVYEGLGQTVTLERLLPGLQLCFRVRARSAPNLTNERLCKSLIDHDELWGVPSSPVLKVTLPPVVPSAPASAPRVVGSAKSTSLFLSWDAPKHTGGAPVLAYEASSVIILITLAVWQLDLESSRLSDDDESGTDSLPRSNSSRSSNRSRSASESSLCPLAEDRTRLRQYALSKSLTVPNAFERSSSMDSTLFKRAACSCSCSHYALHPQKHSVLDHRFPMSSSQHGSLVCSVPTTECRVNHLHPGRSYAFRVRACNLVGRGLWSPWSTCSTSPSPPAAPTRPPRVQPQLCTVNETTSTMVRISWTPVTRTNGAKLTGYLLEWQPLPPQTPYHTTTMMSTPNQTVVKKTYSHTSISTSSLRHKGPTDFQLLYSGPALSYDLHGAQPASRLAFRVCAVNSAGPGPWGPVSTCLTPSAPPGQPGGLRAVECRLPNHAHVQWLSPQPNGSPITSFSIELNRMRKDFELSDSILDHEPNESSQLFDIPAPIPQSVPDAFDDRSTDLRVKVKSKNRDCAFPGNDWIPNLVGHLFTDLYPETWYRVRVRALNALGYGPFSAPLLFTTLPPIPSAPQFVSPPSQLAATSVRLHWLPCLNTASSPELGSRFTGRPTTSSSGLLYTLQCCSIGQLDSDWTTVYEGYETNYKVTRLWENTTYHFRVKASNITGSGDYGQIQSVTTLRLPPAAVRGLKVTELTPDSCQLEWTGVTQTGPDAVIYLAQLMPVLPNTHGPFTAITPIEVYRGSQTNCRVTELPPGTEYVARVCAIRLCQPAACASPAQSVDPDQVDVPPQSECQSNYRLIELPGAFSHSITFSTRPTKGFRSAGLDLITPAYRETCTGKGAKLGWRLSAIICLPLRLLRLKSYSSVNNGGNTNNPGSSPRSLPTLATWPITTGPVRRRAGGSAFISHVNTSPTVSPVPASSTTVAPLLSPLSPTQQQLQRQPQSGTAHHSSSKRSQHLFRLSDRKLAFLFLILFATVTLLVSVGLQHLLVTQPTATSSDTLVKLSAEAAKMPDVYRPLDP